MVTLVFIVVLKKTVVVGKTPGSESSISFETSRKPAPSNSKMINNSENIRAQKPSTLLSKSSSNTTNQKQQINNKGK